MSKFFSKRSGFTLVEIVVAFAVFSIMAAMLVSLAGLAVRQRQSNNNLSRDLSNQQAYLAEHERETLYNAADYGGTFEFDFGGGLNAPPLNYSVVRASDDATSEGGIRYFVADANVNNKPVPGGDDGDGDGGSLVLAEKVDSRLYGSSNFEYIRVQNVNKVTDPSVLSDLGVPSDSSMYTLDVYAVDNDAAIRKEDTRLARNYKMRFESDILDCGYVGSSILDCGYVGSSSNYISYQNATFGSDGKVSGGGSNQFEILPCSGDTVRVSIPHGIISKYFESGSINDSDCFSGVESKFYVVLKGDVALTESSFGSNVTLNEFGQHVYYPVKAKVTTTDKDGNDHTEDVNFINVYGAFAKAGTVILNPEVP